MIPRVLLLITVRIHLKDVRQVSEVDGGLHLVGTDANGARDDLVLTPRP